MTISAEHHWLILLIAITLVACTTLPVGQWRYVFTGGNLAILAWALIAEL